MIFDHNLQNEEAAVATVHRTQKKHKQHLQFITKYRNFVETIARCTLLACDENFHDFFAFDNLLNVSWKARIQIIANRLDIRLWRRK